MFESLQTLPQDLNRFISAHLKKFQTEVVDPGLQKTRRELEAFVKGTLERKADTQTLESFKQQELPRIFQNMKAGLDASVKGKVDVQAFESFKQQNLPLLVEKQISAFNQSITRTCQLDINRTNTRFSQIEADLKNRVTTDYLNNSLQLVEKQISAFNQSIPRTCQQELSRFFQNMKAGLDASVKGKVDTQAFESFKQQELLRILQNFQTEQMEPNLQKMRRDLEARVKGEIDSRIKAVNQTVQLLQQDIQRSISEQMRKFQTERMEPNFQRLQRDLDRRDETIDAFENSLRNIQSRIEELEKQNKDKDRQIAELQQRVVQSLEAKPRVTQSGAAEKHQTRAVFSQAEDPTLRRFNDWAEKPTHFLPSGFSFIKGEPKIRTNQALDTTDTETLWILNRAGANIYLFPNPSLFDQMTDISELYQMDQSKLKAKGSNRIRVLEACVVAEGGYINYPGEVQLL
jgi:hypothetical protein